MLKEVRLSNARGFKDRVWQFPLSSFSIFCGTNSAGKSTVIKAIQLLRQNLVPRMKASSGKFKLQLSGQHVELGNFTSFVSHEQSHRELTVGVSISHYLSSDTGAPFAPSAAESTPEDDLLLPYDLDCDFIFGTSRQFGPTPESLSLDANLEETDEVGPPGQEAVLKKATFLFRPLGEEKSFCFAIVRSAPATGEEANYFLEMPEHIFGNEEAYNFIDAPSVIDGKIRLRTTLRSLLPDRLIGRFKQTLPDGNEGTVQRPIPLPSVIEEIFADVRGTLNNVVYLGPLRAPAERYYTGQPDYNLASDTTGKSLPYLIRDRIESFVQYVPPGRDLSVRQSLGEALNFWLYYIRTGNSPDDTTPLSREVVVDTLEDILVQFEILSPDGKEAHALADSGFGYSQLLPFIARGLLMNSGSTLVIEQPEVHLNPALQIRISEFFISLALASKQVIIETHSEHIVNYLRVRAAEDHRGSVSAASMILYIDSQHGEPSVHPLGVRPDGSIPDWPSGFFGEAASLSARILRAQRMHRQGKLVP